MENQLGIEFAIFQLQLLLSKADSDLKTIQWFVGYLSGEINRLKSYKENG